MILKLFILTFIIINNSFAFIPAGPEKLTCGKYKLQGILKEERISSTQFILEVYPNTRRSYEMTLSGFFGVEHAMYKTTPVVITASFLTKESIEKYQGEILNIQPDTSHDLDNHKSKVELLESYVCNLI